MSASRTREQFRVVAVQCRAGDPLPATVESEWQDADLVAFPEYWRCGPSLRSYEESAARHENDLAEIASLAKQSDAAFVAGTLVAPRDGGGYENRAYVLDRGAIVGYYSKVHPMPGEMREGIVPGETFRAFEVRGIRLGVLICSDVLAADSFPEMATRHPDVIVIPTSSPYREVDSPAEKHARDRDIFVAGAARAGAYVVKVCTLGPIFGHRLQGRSLVAAPWGVLEGVAIEDEDVPRIVAHTLDLARLRAWRREHGWREGENRGREIEREKRER
jgi:predicted amidohydrolase